MTDERSYGEQVRTWSNVDLLDVARHIDKDAFPARHRIVRAEIERRRSARTPDAFWLPTPPTLTKYSTFWRRVGAMLLDWLILLPVSVGAGFLEDAISDPLIAAVPALVNVLICYLYSIILHARNGQTIGKMVTRVRVLDQSETKLSVSQAITRDLVPLSLSIAVFVVMVNIELPAGLTGLDFTDLIPLIVLTSIGYLWWLAEVITMATNRRRRAVHDFIAGSVVVWIDAPAGNAVAARNAGSGTNEEF